MGNKLERFVEKAKDLSHYIMGGGAGALAGGGIAWYGRISAEAAVKVRPELGTVDFWTAFLADHGTDWLFYHNPNEMTALYMTITTLVGLGVTYLLKR